MRTWQHGESQPQPSPAHFSSQALTCALRGLMWTWTLQPACTNVVHAPHKQPPSLRAGDAHFLSVVQPWEDKPGMRLVSSWKVGSDVSGWGIQIQVPRIWFRQVGMQAPGGHILMSPWTPQPMGRCMAKKHQSSALQNTALGQEPFSAQGGVLEVYTLQPLAVGSKQPSRRC